MLSNGDASVFDITLQGDFEAVIALVNKVKLFLHNAQVRDAHSLIIQSANTAHSQLITEQI